MSSSNPVTTKLALVSHPLCPYVQRAAIVITEKGLAVERRYIDFSQPPPWFKAISPLGKTPVLLVGQTPIFESAVICEYLDDTYKPRLHPTDALQRARHRAWIEFASSVLNDIAGLYNAKQESAFQTAQNSLREKFQQLETELNGPYFAGERFCLVDAAFAPVFRYFDSIECHSQLRFFGHTPRLQTWRKTLAKRPSVRNAVGADFDVELTRFLRSRNSLLASSMVDRLSESIDKPICEPTMTFS